MGENDTKSIDQARVIALKRREDARFAELHPRSLALEARGRRSMPLGVPLSWMAFLYDHPPLFVDSADGAMFRDVDGHDYLDVNLGITVASAGHTPAPVIDAVTDRLRRGIQFGLPTEDAIVVSEELARRHGLPCWQYVLSSTQANTEVIRLARMLTGRERVVVFEGKYQGHVGELLAVADGSIVAPEYHGITSVDIARTVVVSWNDLDRVEHVLASGDVAVLLVEPALTNSGIVFPEPGFHKGLRHLTAEHGVVLALDETQTLPMAYGGLMRAWGLEADTITLGKSLGGGIPVAAYGLNEALVGLIDREFAPYDVSGDAVDEPAIGGTLFGSALSLAAVRAALEHVWIEDTYARTNRLAALMADGMRTAIRGHGRDWDVYHLGNRAGYRFSPLPPRNNAEAGERDIPAVRHLQRVYFLNRGIWEFGWWGGPAVSAQTTEPQARFYVEVFGEFLAELLGP